MYERKKKSCAPIVCRFDREKWLVGRDVKESRSSLQNKIVCPPGA